MIIIPDIHGRDFWKDAVNGLKEGEKAIFLGDYLDPYPHEWPPKNVNIWETIWDNFNEIIDYKKDNPKDVILLLGNHDLQYFFTNGDCSRYDYLHARGIREKFIENEALFQMAYEETVNKKRFIFSHAGIHKLWIKDWFENAVNSENIVDYLNNAYLVKDQTFISALEQYSAYRGGFDSYGSMVWADIREWWSDEPKKSDYGDVQVFGHTQLRDNPINFHNTYYCLDVRRAFRIDDNGNVCELDGTVIPKTEK